MKHFKKFFSYLVALTMVLSLAAFTGVKVHAADGTTGTEGPTNYTLTVLNNNGTKDGPSTHTFEIYQIFTGDYNDTVLSNIKWGSGVTTDGQKAIGDAKTYAEENLKTPNDAKAFAKRLADGASGTSYLTSPIATKEITPGSSAEVDVPAGYYLIKDQDGSQNIENGAYTDYIVKVVGDTTANTKLDVPSVVKKVKDHNDTTGDTSDWQDSADYDIGENVPYQLTGTLPSDYSKYTEYAYTFNDQMSKGLTFNNDIKVYKNSASEKNLIPAAQYGVTSDEHSFSIKFDNLKKVTTNASDQIIVTYSAQLNDKAQIGKQGNDNTVYLKYSNNPNYTGKGENSPEGQTPKDKNIVFTYQLNVNKYKDAVGDSNKTDKAQFQLFKEMKDGKVKPITITADSDTKLYSAKGLDDGTYILQETKAPDGYNKMDGSVTFGSTTYENAKEFKIEATHEDKSDNPKLLSLSGTATKTGEATFTAGGTKTTAEDGSETQIYDGTLTTNMGTTLLYVAGGILVACAAAYVVMSRKHSTNK